MYKVSIIVPIYNVEMYLAQCLDSIRAQSLQEIEIICIDDGSTDSCLSILQDYVAKDKRIKVISQSNAGYGRAMNVGITHASGEYIGIVEPDDYVLSEMFETLYNEATSNDCEIVKSDFYRFSGDGDTLKENYISLTNDEKYYNTILNPSEDTECFKFTMNTWCGIYKRDFLLKNKIFHSETPGASFQDNGFWFKGFCCAKRLLLLRKAFYMNRRDNPGSSVANKGKVYAANVEYNLLYDYLCQDKVRKATFAKVLRMKQWHNCIFTIQRIAAEFRHEYIQKISEEFAVARQNGELDESLFTPLEWTRLNMLINDADEYYYTVERNRIRVSVILPVYNAERFLRQCLDSIITQKLRDIEIICIDDGSTDSSPEILKEYAAADGRFIIITTKNGGAGVARNIGISKACGKYLYFPDSDDWLEPNTLSAAYDQAEKTRADITVFRSVLYDNETGNSQNCDFSLRMEKLPKYQPFRASAVCGSVLRTFMGWAWDKLYLRSFVVNNSLQFQEQRTTNDMYFVFISLYKASGIAVLNQYLYSQRRNVSNSLSATREKSWDCFYKALSAVKNEMMAMGIFEAYKADFVDYALHSCLWNLNTLKDDIGAKLYECLRNEWFEALGILSVPQETFTQEVELAQFRDIVENQMTYAEYREKWPEPPKTIAPAPKQHNPAPRVASLEEIERLEHELKCIKNSVSFRVGRMITWLPRKILRRDKRKNKKQ